MGGFAPPPPSLHDFTPLSLGLLCARSGSRGARDSLKVDSSFCRGDLHGKRYSEELKIEAVKRVVERVYALPSD